MTQKVYAYLGRGLTQLWNNKNWISSDAKSPRLWENQFSPSIISIKWPVTNTVKIQQSKSKLLQMQNVHQSRKKFLSPHACIHKQTERLHHVILTWGELGGPRLKRKQHTSKVEKERTLNPLDFPHFWSLIAPAIGDVGLERGFFFLRMFPQ